jgi:uncharacterized protein YegP (UPF0339 family)
VAAKFVLKKGSTGKYHFNLVATNGQVIASRESYESYESYESKASAINGIESVKRNAQRRDRGADLELIYRNRSGGHELARRRLCAARHSECHSTGRYSGRQDRTRRTAHPT